MAIVGLTVSETGESLQRLAITTKVAIGEVVKTEKGTHPRKLDHFVFLRKSTQKLEWEPDPELTQHFGGDCREAWIILLNDELENVFRTEYAWWSKTEKKCWGDGREATRRTPEHPDGQPWQGCGESCPDLNLEKGGCSPSGDLYFVLADYPRLGSVCRIHTGSYRSIRQIHSALEQIRTVTGGRLAGIRCKLVVRPEKAAYMDASSKSKKSTTIYALNIELSAGDMTKLISEMTQHAQLFQQTQKLLGGGRKVEFVAEDEPETERAPDVAQEFYPAEEIKPAVQQPQRASAPITPEVMPNEQPTINADQRRKFFAIATEAGWSQTQMKDLLLEHWGFDSTSRIPVEKYAEICAAFESCQMPPKQDVLPYQATDEDVPW